MFAGRFFARRFFADRYFNSGTAAGVVELVPSTGAISVVGNAPSITVVINPSLGVVTTVGIAPTITSILAATLGPIVATGPPLALVSELAASSAAVTVDGGIATLVHAIAPELAPVTAAGNEPSIVEFVTVELEPSTGAVSADGIAPSLAIIIEAQTGEIVIAGIAATLDSIIAPSLAAVTFDGNAPSLGELVPIILEPTVGVVSASGLAPTILFELANSPAPVSVDGLTPGVQSAILSSPGAAVIDGGTPTLTASIAPALATVQVSGNEPGLIAGGIIVLYPDVAQVTVGGNAPFLPAVTKLPPNEVLASTNTTGAVTAIDDDPANPDANWITATDATSATDLRVGFEDPAPVSPPDGNQRFLLYLRKTAGTPNPTVDVELWQNGSYVSTLLNDASISSAGGQLLDATWVSSALTGTLDGTDVECRVVSTPGSGSIPGALPVYAAAGNVFNNATLAQTNLVAGGASWTGGMPAHAAGDLLFCLVLCRNTDNGGDGVLTNVNGTGGTTGWTLDNNAGAMYGGVQTARIAFGWKIAAGASEAISISTTGGATSDRIHARVFKFTAANGFDASAIQDIGSPTTGTLSAGQDMNMPTVASGGANELGLCIYGISTTCTIDAAGGGWDEPVAETSGTNGASGIQTADLSGGGGISGGTAAASATTGVWVALGMRIVPASTTGNINTVEIGAIEWDALLGPRTITLAGSLGAAVISGQVPGISNEISAVPGSAVVAGGTPTVAVLLAPVSAIVVAAGSFPAIVSDLAPGVAAVSVAGIAPSVATVLAPSSTAVTVAGNAPALSQYRELSPSTGAAEVVGQTASLASVLFPALGEVTIAGNAPSVSIVILVEYAPSTGAVETTGYASSIELGLLPGIGQAIAGGLNPGLLTELVPSTAAATISGEAPTVGFAKIIDPDTGLVGLVGESPGLSFELAPSSGSVSIVGQPVGLLLGREPLPAAVGIVGSDPELLLFLLHATVDFDLAVQVTDRSVGADLDLAVFSFNPFLEPPTGDYEVIISVEDRELEISEEDRLLILPPDQREA